jgi:DNA-binding response OmpR family regulator
MRMVVKVLRWPADSRKREQCEVLGVPRLLVVEGGAALPTCLDALEDWVRPPISQEELKVRTATLEARARHNAQPTVDANEMLCFGNRRLQLSAGEAKLMRLFVEHYGSVVPREQLAESGWPREDPPRRNALDLRILRLRRRVEPLSLSIRTVWGRGYLLEAAFAPAAVAR